MGVRFGILFPPRASMGTRLGIDFPPRVSMGVRFGIEFPPMPLPSSSRTSKYFLRWTMLSTGIRVLGRRTCLLFVPFPRCQSHPVANR
eukprot:6095562-Pyramimonas_sp.AAC.1